MFFGSTKPLEGKASAVVVKPVEEVFQFIGEDFFKNYPRWSTEVVELKSMSDGPVRVGTRAKQVRVDYGRRSESIFTVVDFQANQRIAFSGMGQAADAPRSSAYRCAYDLDDPRLTQPCTRVTFTFEVPELELFMRPFEKLIRVAVQEGAEHTVKNVKSLIEKGVASKAVQKARRP